MPDRAPPPLPRGPCPDCIQADQGRIHPSGRMAIYCPHHRAGGVLQPTTDGAAMWTIWTPVTRDEFEASLARYAERLQAAHGASGATLQ